MTKVILYFAPACSWCHRAKDYLESKGIEFQEIDVSTNQEAGHVMMSKSGQMGVPQIEINGKMIVGFNQEALEKEIRAMKTPAEGEVREN